MRWNCMSKALRFQITTENQDCPFLYRISNHSVRVWDRVRVTLTLTLKQHSLSKKIDPTFYWHPNATHSNGLIIWAGLASFAKESFIPEPPFLFWDWTQWASVVCYLLSFFWLGLFSGPPGKRDYLTDRFPSRLIAEIKRDRIFSIIFRLLIHWWYSRKKWDLYLACFCLHDRLSSKIPSTHEARHVVRLHFWSTNMAA